MESGALMKILAKDLRHGALKLVPETSDDLWALYLAISEGDLVRARTFREIKFGERGSGHSSRVPMVLTIKVTSLEFQAFTDRLRIRGVIVEGPERFGLKGKYHTLNISVGSELEIIKPRGWPQHLLERLERQVSRVRLLLVAIDYDEYAIGVLTPQGLKILHEEPTRLPAKDDPRRVEEEKGLMTRLAKELEEHINKFNPLAVIIAGPGFLKNRLADLLREKLAIRLVVDNVSSGGIAGLNELIKRDSVKQVARELVVIEAEKFFEEFDKRIGSDEMLVVYGLKDVARAALQGALEKVIVLDELVHSYDEDERRLVEEVLRRAESQHADIIFINTESPQGQRLKLLGGIAALLRFPIYLGEEAATS
ncbi:MAG: mRNA surveillance protein pelota [Pyrodictiaceae archaeon]